MAAAHPCLQLARSDRGERSITERRVHMQPQVRLDLGSGRLSVNLHLAPLLGVGLEGHAACGGIDDASVAQHATTLADPADLLAHVDAADLTDDDGTPDPEKITVATAALLAKKPHLASRKPAGDIDQGARGGAPESADFAVLLRKAAT